MPRTGGTGSIGVISMHVDWSQALTEAGVKVTFITYGERKADGHPRFHFQGSAYAVSSDIDTMGRCSLPRWRATAACRQNKSVRRKRARLWARLVFRRALPMR